MAIDPNNVTIVKVGSLPGIPTLTDAYVHMLKKGQGNYAVTADIFCFTEDYYDKTAINTLLLQQANDIISELQGTSLYFTVGFTPDAPEDGATTFTLPDEFFGKEIEIFSSDLAGFLEPGVDFTRSPTALGLELELLNGNTFLDGGRWKIKS